MRCYSVLLALFNPWRSRYSIPIMNALPAIREAAAHPGPRRP